MPSSQSLQMIDLLKRGNLTLEEAVNLCRANEVTEKQIKIMTEVQYPEVKKVQEKIKIKKGKCRFCSNIHEFIKEKCPAWGTICKNCKGKNHLEKACKKKKIKKIQDEVANEEPSSSEQSD